MKAPIGRQARVRVTATVTTVMETPNCLAMSGKPKVRRKKPKEHKVKPQKRPVTVCLAVGVHPFNASNAAMPFPLLDFCERVCRGRRIEQALMHCSNCGR